MSQEKQPSIETLNQQIIELETKATFQDHLIDELNQALIQQQGDITKLTRMVEQIGSQVEGMSQSTPNPGQVEVPPHY